MPQKLPAVIAATGALLALSAPALAAHHPAQLHPRLGYYQCYQTTRDVSQINGEVSYSTRFTESFTLKPGLKYEVSFRTAPDYRTQHVAVRGTGLRFVGGPYDSAANSLHLSGTMYPHGVTMPNSQMNPAQHYTLVLHGRPGDSDAGPPASKTGDYSFWYCKTR